jgi:hypothetical protein
MEFVGGRRPVATEQTAPARGTDPEITSVKYGIGFDCFVGRSGPRPLFGAWRRQSAAASARYSDDRGRTPSLSYLPNTWVGQVWTRRASMGLPGGGPSAQERPVGRPRGGRRREIQAEPLSHQRRTHRPGRGGRDPRGVGHPPTPVTGSSSQSSRRAGTCQHRVKSDLWRPSIRPNRRPVKRPVYEPLGRHETRSGYHPSLTAETSVKSG